MSRGICTLLWVLLGLGLSAGQVNTDPKEAARFADLPLLRCGVCKLTAERIVARVSDEREKDPSISEEDLLRIADNVCDPDTLSGAWVNSVKIEHDKPNAELKLQLRDDEGLCKKSCRTISRACQDVIDGKESDIADAFYKPDVPVTKIESIMCGVCKRKCPAVPAGWTPADEYVIKSEERKAVDAQMRMMKEQNPGSMPPMTMFDANDIDNFADGEISEDEDDSEEELAEDDADGSDVTADFDDDPSVVGSFNSAPVTKKTNENGEPALDEETSSKDDL